MALTLTITTPLTADDRNVLSALLGTPATVGEFVAAAPAPTPETVSETEPDAGAPESGEGLDADGLPWDEMIHSGNKKRNADGRWQRRRGVQDAVFDARVAELRAAFGADGSGAVPAEDVFAQQVDAAAQTLVTPPAPPAPPALATTAEAPPAPPAEAPPPPAPAPAVISGSDGNEWEGQPGFLKIMKLVTAKKLPAEKLNELLVSVGLAPTTTSLLKADADTRAAFAALLEGAE